MMKGMIIVNEKFFNIYIFGSDDKGVIFLFQLLLSPNILVADLNIL